MSKVGGIASSFVVTSARMAPNVLVLAGTLDAHGAADLEAAAERALRDSSMGLVLDVAALTRVNAAGIAAINRVGALAQLHATTATVQTPGDHLQDELAVAALHDGVRVEVTQPVPSRARTAAESAPTPARPGPSDGVARKTGPGFIASFGQGRTCAATGCTTRLSQYNAADRCGVHDLTRQRGQISQ